MTSATSSNSGELLNDLNQLFLDPLVRKWIASPRESDLQHIEGENIRLRIRAFIDKYFFLDNTYGYELWFEIWYRIQNLAKLAMILERRACIRDHCETKLECIPLSLARLCHQIVRNEDRWPLIQQQVSARIISLCATNRYREYYLQD